jgi:hypothetical protein
MKPQELGPQSWQAFKRFISFFVIWAYFALWWVNKPSWMRITKYSSYSVLVIFSLFHVSELSTQFIPDEWWGFIASASWFSHRVHASLPSWVTFKLVAFSLIILALCYTVWYEINEARQPEHEFHIVSGLHQLLVDGLRTKSPEQMVSNTLRTAQRIFDYADVKHVCIHTVDDDGVLRILPHHVFPRDESSSFCATLPKGKGGARKAFDEHLIIYVPRMHFFRTRFAHAATYKYVDTIPTKDDLPVLLEIELEDIALNVFEPPNYENLNFRSFVSVPIRTVGGRLSGVLNIDFGRTNPLDINGLKLADAFSYFVSSFLPPQSSNSEDTRNNEPNVVNHESNKQI